MRCDKLGVGYELYRKKRAIDPDSTRYSWAARGSAFWLFIRRGGALQWHPSTLAWASSTLQHPGPGFGSVPNRTQAPLPKPLLILEVRTPIARLAVGKNQDLGGENMVFQADVPLRQNTYSETTNLI